MVSLIIRYVVSVIYYEPYIYGDPKAYVWYRGYVSFFNYGYNILMKENLSILSNWAVNIYFIARLGMLFFTNSTFLKDYLP